MSWEASALGRLHGLCVDMENGAPFHLRPKSSPPSAQIRHEPGKGSAVFLPPQVILPLLGFGVQGVTGTPSNLYLKTLTGGYVLE